MHNVTYHFSLQFAPQIHALVMYRELYRDLHQQKRAVTLSLKVGIIVIITNMSDGFAAARAMNS